MTDYVVENGFIKFNVTLSNDENIIVEIPETDNPQAAIDSFTAEKEAELKWLEQLNQG